MNSPSKPQPASAPQSMSNDSSRPKTTQNETKVEKDIDAGPLPISMSQEPPPPYEVQSGHTDQTDPNAASSPDSYQYEQQHGGILPTTNPPIDGYGFPSPFMTPDEIEQLNRAMIFSERTVRFLFIKKVYGILAFQLLITTGIISLIIFIPEVKLYIYSNPMIFFIAIGIYLVFGIGLSCCGSCRYHSPMNYICLAIFTVATGIVVGTFASAYRIEFVILAFGTTAVMSLGLSLFAFQTKWDFTLLGGILWVVCIWFFLFGLLLPIFAFGVPGTFNTIHIVYDAIGVLLFSVYLVYDTQLMLGGKHTYAYHPEDYIIAVLQLYLDIILIFMHLLSLFGNRN